MEGQEIVITVRKSESKHYSLHGEIRMDGAFVCEGDVLSWSIASVDLLIHGLLQQAVRRNDLKLVGNWQEPELIPPRRSGSKDIFQVEATASLVASEAGKGERIPLSSKNAVRKKEN